MKIRQLYILCMSVFCYVVACDVRFPCSIDDDCPGAKCVEGFCQNIQYCNYLNKPHGVCKDLERDHKGVCPKPADYSETEICGDGKDNNCNGSIDEGCCPASCSKDDDCKFCPTNQQSCLNGKCGVCQVGQTDCTGVCRNLQSDADNCGACGNKCPTSQSCCSGVCRNQQIDADNCGACGNKCPTGQSCCSGVCRNQQSDADNCGACGNKCAAGQVCTNGKCHIQLAEVKISAGRFTMGSPSSELGRYSDGGPQRTVTLTRSFMIGKYEVTQGEFESLMGYNPSYNKSCGANCPVEAVSWHEAVAYMNALSKSRGLEECFDCTGSGTSVNCTVKSQYSGQNYYNCKGYRLPTEAEWEYAYRAGTSTAFYNGDITKTGCVLDPNLDKIGWYCGNSGYNTHPVGGKQANAWGLHDMAGNVWEWVYDRFQDSYNNLPSVDPVGPGTGSDRVVRGGSYNISTQACRAAVRFGYLPGNRYGSLGCRFLRVL